MLVWLCIEHYEKLADLNEQLKDLMECINSFNVTLSKEHWKWNDIVQIQNVKALRYLLQNYTRILVKFEINLKSDWYGAFSILNDLTTIKANHSVVQAVEATKICHTRKRLKFTHPDGPGC